MRGRRKGDHAERSAKCTAEAKRLRREITKAEVILRLNLRALREDGYNFRRQHPVGPYIADFAVHSGKLIVEVDAATHDSENDVEHDQKRDAYLHGQGWRVLRIPNVAVYDNLEHVIETILSHMPPTVSPLRGDPPLPQAGEDK